MMGNRLPISLGITVLIVFTVLSLFANGVTIMSIDLGSEWMKIAVVAPGMPMEIALNKESKRKTPVAITFRDGERTFGDDALSAGMRSPTSSYAYILDLLGKEIDNPVVKDFQNKFPYYNIEADPVRNTVIFRHDSNTTYSVEELCAQIFNYGGELAAKHTNQKVKDLVITVPPFFNQAERRAILDSAKLANLKVLSLMNSNAAVGLNYGMFRRKEINETAQNILFYDMGASFTTATIASYQTIKTKEHGYTETNPQVSILGVGYDRSLGGLEMQLRLRDFFGKKFNEMKKTKTDVFTSARAMAKLMKAAGRTKYVLSANSDHLCQVEGVLDDQDFSYRISREDFENLWLDLYERLQDPVNAALVSAGIDISEIHQFIIVGGNTRIPRIQAKLQEIWGKELGKNINADEASALGAVYRAADLGQGFKVMKFHVKESIIFPIDVEFERVYEHENGSTGIKAVKRSLFGTGNFYPQKKVMTFNRHTHDFGFVNNYGDFSQLSKTQTSQFGKRNISYVMVSGVTEIFEKQTGEGSDPKGVKAHFILDDSGILSISSIEAVFEKNVTVAEEVIHTEESTLSKIGSTLSKIFKGGEEEDTSNGTQSAKNKSTHNNISNSNDKNENGTASPKFKLVAIREELKFSVNNLDLTDLSIDQLSVSNKKIKHINDMEIKRRLKEKSRNILESYILDIGDKFTHEEYESASTQKIRDEIKAKASELEEWLYDDGFDQSASVYKERLKTLEILFEPIKNRVREHRERPDGLKALHDMINMSSAFLHAASSAQEEEKYFTDVEQNTLNELILNTQKWIEEKEELQEKTSLEDDPPLTLYSIADKMASLDREIKYLINKAKMVKIRKDKEAVEAKIKAEMKAREADKNTTEFIEADKNTTEFIEADNVMNETIIETDSKKEPPLPVEDESEHKMEEPVNDEQNEMDIAHEEM